MSYKEKIESFLVELSFSSEELGENIWAVSGEEKGMENVIVMIEEPLLIIRVKVMAVPKKEKTAFFEELLKLNATDLTHGAYGIEGDNIILIDTLEVDTLALKEFQASLDAISLALVQHYPLLEKYRE
ncbi:MAG TPA: hypothetical protein VMX75_12890 [Spirochaetia bacterium]|nr:hypothetical protein [Spirochaetia bacterium]